MSVKLISTSPYGDVTNLPISVSAMKDYMRVSSTNEDSLIQDFIVGAIDMLEKRLNTSFVQQQHVAHIDYSPMGIPNSAIQRRVLYLSRPPIISVTSVVFTDEDGTETMVDPDIYHVDAEQGRLLLRYGEEWPACPRAITGIKVTYESGLVTSGNGADLPNAIKRAVSAMSAYLYEHRMLECCIPSNIYSICASYYNPVMGRPALGFDTTGVITRHPTIGGY